MKEQIKKKFVLWRKIVAGTLCCVLAMVIAPLTILLSITGDVSEIWGVIAVLSALLFMTVVSIVYQFYLIKKANNTNLIVHPDHIQKVCNPYHLLYEIKFSHRKFYLFLTTYSKF